jgi:tetratricopeptide (TPR) repeat protein
MTCPIFRHLLIAALILFPTTISAQRERDTYTGGSQTFEVSGEVRLGETGASAQSVPVRLERFSGGIIDQIITDNRGHFRFPNLQKGYYKVVVDVPGYRPAQQDADLQVLFRLYLVFDITSDTSKSSAALPLLNDVVDARIPATARDELESGKAALTKRSYQPAIAHLDRAILAYPTFFEAHLLLATAYMDLREWDKAEQALLRALEIRPENATALISLGEVYWRQNRYAVAEQTLKEGLKLDEKSWHGNFTLGRLYWDMGEVAKAGAPIGMTLQLKPELAEAHLLAGNILLRVSQKERALIEYREYLRLEPKGEFAPQVQQLIQRVQRVPADKK